MVTVPDGIAGVTAEWLSQSLDREVRHVEVSRIGTGQTGCTYRLHLDDGSTLVAKTGAEDPDVRQRVAYGYRAELAFYRDIAPTVDVPVPTVHASAATDDCSQFVLVMDDLSPAAQGDQIVGATAEVVLEGARALAGLHGPRWCDPSWKDLEVLTMPLATEDSAQGMGDLARMATDTFLDTLGPRLSADDRATLDAFPKAVPDWLLAHPDRFALLHGDFRLDNLMLHPEGGVTVVDWQTLTVGLPGRDLAYWIATSVDPRTRRRIEGDAVSAYHSALGVDDYELATCEEDYRAGQLHTLLITTLGWAFTTQTERGGDMMTVMARRACAAIRDLGVLA
jgi:aminoglycoside phosphotransferase (APT) family kinase protein